MVKTPHFGNEPLTEAQDDKEVTINNTDLRAENATQRILAVDMTAGDITLTETQFASNFTFLCSNQTANRKLILPDKLDTNAANTASRFIRVENDADDFNVEVEQETASQNIIILPKTAATLQVDGTNIKRADSGMSLGGFAAGIPAANALLFQFVATESFTLEAALAGTQSFLKTATTLATSYVIQKNEANIGTIDFGAVATVGTYTFVTTTSFVAGDRLAVLAPAVPDATAADLSYMFSARRT